MTDQPIQYAESSDGTRIAYRRFGSGRPVVFVGGALSTAEAAGPLAAAFAEAGLQGVTYDRRGRGDSGDTAPYAPEREAEDLRAVIDAVGGAAVVLGHSSGAVLSLFAAAEGVPMTHLFLSEPPLRFGQNEPPADLADRLQALVDQGENEEAVLLFLREDVGMPEPAIEQLRASPAFAGLVPLAQTTVYDNRLVASVSTPTAAMLGVDVPTTILRGDPTVPLLVTAVERLAAAMPGTELVRRAGVTRPWRRPRRDRSRGACPNRLIIACAAPPGRLGGHAPPPGRSPAIDQRGISQAVVGRHRTVDSRRRATGTRSLGIVYSQPQAPNASIRRSRSLQSPATPPRSGGIGLRRLGSHRCRALGLWGSCPGSGGRTGQLEVLRVAPGLSP